MIKFNTEVARAPETLEEMLEVDSSKVSSLYVFKEAYSRLRKVWAMKRSQTAATALSLAELQLNKAFATLKSSERIEALKVVKNLLRTAYNFIFKKVVVG